MLNIQTQNILVRIILVMFLTTLAIFIPLLMLLLAGMNLLIRGLIRFTFSEKNKSGFPGYFPIPISNHPNTAVTLLAEQKGYLNNFKIEKGTNN